MTPSNASPGLMLAVRARLPTTTTPAGAEKKGKERREARRRDFFMGLLNGEDDGGEVGGRRHGDRKAGELELERDLAAGLRSGKQLAVQGRDFGEGLTTHDRAVAGAGGGALHEEG